MMVTLIRLVHHDAASIGLKLEIADAVKCKPPTNDLFLCHHDC